MSKSREHYASSTEETDRSTLPRSSGGGSGRSNDPYASGRKVQSPKGFERQREANEMPMAGPTNNRGR
jgi:hypothetical protein